MARMIFPALRALGYDNYHHVFRGATYADQTVRWVARAVMHRKANLEQASGLNVIYHRPFTTFPTMVRLLNRNAIVAVNGDGMMGSDFVDVPYLGGTMSFPTGPARLAVHAGAPILSAYCLSEGLNRHRLIVHPPIHCSKDSPASVASTVRAYVEILEEYVRQYPWAWWTWRRLNIEEGADGKIRFVATALPTEQGLYYNPDHGSKHGRK
jgi:lauroyl/myristoyl acyltransferase